LTAEQNENSRLFVVDAGLDLGTLERTYPDRNRYAIVRGRIRPRVVGEFSATAKLYGSVSQVSCDAINVPLQFRAVFPASSTGLRLPKYGGPRFHVTVAFGRRLEPWIVAANAG